MRPRVYRPGTKLATVTCVVCGKPLDVREKDLEDGKRWVCEDQYDCFREDAATVQGTGARTL